MNINRKTNMGLNVSKSTMRLFSILIMFVMLFAMCIPSYAATTATTATITTASEDTITIKLTVGSTKLNINGTIIKIEQPYITGKTLYIPLQAVLEAIGADYIVKASNKVAVSYMENSAEITIGSKILLLNGAKATLSVAPVMKNKILMVPVEFMNRFINSGLTVTTKGKETVLKLIDNGALSDLSFLIGGITQPKAGNSYFGWNMNIPKGSRISSESFNSKYVAIENNQRALAIEVSVESTDGKTLKEKVDQTVADYEDSDSEELIDSEMFDKAVFNCLMQSS